MRSHTKFGPDRFSRFDVYPLQTNKQTPKHPDRQAKYGREIQPKDDRFKTIVLGSFLHLFSLMVQKKCIKKANVENKRF